MKIVHSFLFRALCAAAIGILLITHPERIIETITIAIGVIFLISGVIALIAYYVAKRKKAEYSSNAEQDKNTEIVCAENISYGGDQSITLVVAIGSIILGFILTLMPSFFNQWMMYLLGAIVILGAISQLFSLIEVRKIWHAPAAFWILPSLLLLSGLYIVVNPLKAESIPLVVVGIALIAYALSEVINSIAIYGQRKKRISKADYQEEEPQVIDAVEIQDE